MIQRSIVILINILLVNLIFPVVIFAQAPPPPPGGPGSGDPPIGGTVPIDNGLIFLLLFAVIYASVKLYQARTKIAIKNTDS